MVDKPKRDGDPGRPAPTSGGDPYTVLSYLITGPLLYGGIGWGLDWWLGTGVFLPVGLLLGGAASIYLIWVRYVKS